MTRVAADGELWDLHNLARARRLVDWTVKRVFTHVRGSVAEVGAGIGTYSDRLLDAGAERLLLVEPEEACVAVLHERFDDDSRVEIAAEELPDSPALAAQAGRLDAVVSQNVVEHLDDDEAAVRAMAGTLSPGGVLTLQVPANPRLFGALDRLYGHRRRYTDASLRSLLEAAGLEVIEMRPFNLLGVLGWLANRNRAAPRISPASLRVYELLVLLWRPVEDALRPPWGLSLVAHARRPG